MHHSHRDYYSDGAKLLIIVRWKIVLLGPCPASARENTRCQGEIFFNSNFIQMRFSFELKIITSIFCQFCSLSGSFNNQVTSVVVIIVLHE